MNEDDHMDRRGFLEVVTWAIGGLISAVLGVPIVAYLIGPAVSEKESQGWIRLGTASKVELGNPTVFKASVEQRSGWIVEEERLMAYVLTENGRDYIAMPNICTHLGCRVRWVADRQQFFCPCHNGVFDKDGDVVSGPPPRPLDRYASKVEGEQVLIQTG